MTAEAKLWHRCKGWAHRSVRGKVILASLDAGLLEVTGSAAAVWLVLDEPATEAELRQRVAEALATGRPSPQAVSEGIRVLHSHDLIDSSAKLSGASCSR